MPTYFEKLTAAKQAVAAKAKESYAPPPRLHVDENTGLNRQGLDYVDPINKTKGSAALPPFAKPVLERDEATGEYYVSEDRAYDSTATQAAPELATSVTVLSSAPIVAVTVALSVAPNASSSV